MAYVPEMISRIERRARRVRGASWAARAWLGAASVVFLLSLVANLANRGTGSWPSALAVSSAPIAAIVAYALGRRVRPSLPRLLLAVDERLGLEARLSSLLELGARPAPSFLADRIAQDVAHRDPRWRRGIPVGRAPVVAACLGAAFLAAGLGIGLRSQPPSASTLVSPAASVAAGERAQESASSASENPRNEAVSHGRDTASASPAREHALRDILSELRSQGGDQRADGLAAAAVSAPLAIPTESETPASSLRQDLERLRDRLQQDASPLSDAEKRTLRDYVRTTAPAQETTVDDLLDSSDVDALRRAITQLLGPGSAGAEVEDSTISHLAPEPDGLRPPEAEGAPTAQPAPGQNDPHSASGTLGDGAGSETPPLEGSVRPVFDSESIELTPVAPPSVLGSSGGYSEYVTLGVPVETVPDDGVAVASPALDFDRIDSVLSGRDLPDGAAETIRSYFERITEEES